MDNNETRVGNGILGDIDPAPEPNSPHSGEGVRNKEDRDGSTSGGSDEDRPEHVGTRDVTGGTGGVAPETGGTRNYRSGTGATGGDLGNRPE